MTMNYFDQGPARAADQARVAGQGFASNLRKLAIRTTTKHRTS